MRLWQAGLFSAAVHAGVLALPALEPFARIEPKKPREVLLVKLPLPEAPREKIARTAEAHRPGTPGRDRLESATTAKAAPLLRQPKVSPVQRTVADARRASRVSLERVLRAVPAPRPRALSNPPPKSASPINPEHRKSPPEISIRKLSTPDGATVVARVTRTVQASRQTLPQPASYPHEPDLDFTLGHPAPRPEAGPSDHGRLGAAVLASDAGTISVAVGDGGGDISPRMRIIQRRIDSVVALLRSARRDCPGSKGFVRIEFQIQPNGYPAARRLRASSGDPCLEDRAGAVIHLAEPYPYVSGWVPVTMNFN